jgi:aspartyl aminopeptidase
LNWQVTDSQHLTDLARFIQASPSSFHAVAEVARRLTDAGYTALDESAAWPTGPGKRFVVRDGAIIAWVEPESATSTTPLRIAGSHTDSPGFKLKPKPSIGSHGWLQAGVEVYGGPLLNSWLDRELEFAGRLVFRDGTTELVRTGPLLRFPQLAVHLDRGVNTDGLKLNPQTHMNPILGVGEPGSADIVGLLAGLAGRDGVDVAGYDVVVADTAAPAQFGLDGQLFASARLDNLSSVHSSLVALLGVGDDLDAIPVLAAFDHEEVGSASRSGAGGPFLADVLARIGGGLGATESERLRAFAGSWCLSASADAREHVREERSTCTRTTRSGTTRPTVRSSGADRCLKLTPTSATPPMRSVPPSSRGRARRPGSSTRSSSRTTRCRVGRPSVRSPRRASASAPSTWGCRCCRCTRRVRCAPRSTRRTSPPPLAPSSPRLPHERRLPTAAPAGPRRRLGLRA